LRLFKPKYIVDLPRIHFFDVFHELKRVTHRRNTIQDVIRLKITMSKFESFAGERQTTQIGINTRFDDLRKLVQYTVFEFMVNQRKVSDILTDADSIFLVKSFKKC
jgi:hypothetical protein